MFRKAKRLAAGRLETELRELREREAAARHTLGVREKSLHDLRIQSVARIGDLEKRCAGIQRELDVTKASRAAAQQWIVRLYEATEQAHVIGPNIAFKDPTIRHILQHPRLKALVAAAVSAKGELDRAAVERIYDGIVHTPSKALS